jgi:phage tail sheath gpL-like
MTIPKAVSPSVLTPGVYMIVDLLAGLSAPGNGVLRMALLCPKASTGDLTNDTEVRAGAGETSAGVAYGIGAIGHIAAKLIYAAFPQAQIDFVAPAPGATAADLDVTFAGVPDSDSVVDVDISGRQFEVVWPAADTADEFKAIMNAAIAARTANLPLAASSGGTGISTLTGKVLGNISNDIKVKMALRSQTGTETINSGTSIDTALSGGTTDPDFTNALAAIQGKEYHFILPCLSNEDVLNVATSNNVDLVYNHIASLNHGRNCKLQTFVVGCTGALASAIATTPSSNSCNNAEFGELIECINGRSLPCEFAAREVGGWLAALSLDPAANRIGELFDGCAGSADKIADQPEDAETESALGNGVSLIGYTPQESEFLIRAVTTHSQDAVGGADRRLLDCQNVHASYIVSRDLRDNIALAFPNAKIQKDTKPGEEDPPPGVTEERDIKGWVLSRLIAWADQGVINRPALLAAAADGTLIVEVDDTDPTQVNIVTPHKIIQPLAKFGIVSQRVPS